VARPTPYENSLFHVSASIGITLVDPGDRRTAGEILAAADGAMYAAKASGPGRSVYSG
jgi:GGDEF domain-containing protein